MYKASCHCGNVNITVSNLPSAVTSCNCSICNRLGSLWAYYKPEEVNICINSEPTKTYLWGDKFIELHHCGICGCTTHYTSTEKCEEQRIAVNGRMLNLDTIQSIPIRKFDGADSWRFID
ncbi:GFA family protein [Spartinivicinus poritis]|uniref:Aldehyde-activating protein n=1 Tax=Spartinivicinus poritis TaxID=2994640 RepID=A0ABT5UFC0_9GAMM|nr:aldehyde-activating protein [Spartinivicinus sp. A2-2]MDE1463784.1 aldehyde-activating protein [Spartinivicinus sp. A2-2]